MPITINDYAYVFIRLTTIKTLLMDADDINKLASMNDLESLGNYVKRFFPGFEPEEIEIAEFEWMLWDTYFSIIERILIASPESMQIFLKKFLIQYEILNIKICIYGVIEDTSYEEKYWQVYDRPSEILERRKLLEKLLRATKLNQIVEFLEDTPYYEIVEDGINKYTETKNIFYLEQNLDKFFYTNLIESLDLYDQKIRNLVEQYLRQQIDFYNLNLVYRTLYNELSLEEIYPYLIDHGHLFDSEDLEKFKKLKNIDGLIQLLNKIIKSKKENKKYAFFIEKLNEPDPRAWDEMKQQFFDTFFSRFEREIIQDIPLSSISLIFRILLQKQQEINEITKRSVRIALAAEEY